MNIYFNSETFFSGWIGSNREESKDYYLKPFQKMIILNMYFFNTFPSEIVI